MTQNTPPQPGDALDYRSAGVDIDAGNRLVEQIKPMVKKTMRPEVMGHLGGFGALFELPIHRYQEPVLVSGTDGVGTKLKLANMLNQHDTIGIDLVAMCVNDLIVQGAEPLFFLDYFATGKLDVTTASDVIKGITEGCLQSGCALIGGETAEMPGMYAANDYDLAGFCVGVVEKSRIIDGVRVEVGDQLIGVASSGPHSNGYSLISKIIEVQQVDLRQPFGEQSLGEALLQPTQIYVKPVLQLLEQVDVHAIAHITGGGLLENIPRVLPKHVRAHLKRDRWTVPAIFSWLQEMGKVAPEEMYRTFNCGVGLVLCVAAEDTEDTIERFAKHHLAAWPIGEIESAPESNPIRVVID